MKHYISYMDKQTISSRTHEALLDLAAPAPSQKVRPRHLLPYGALAACAALALGMGIWKLAPAPSRSPASAPSAAGQFAADYTPLPGEKDTVDPEDLLLVTGSEDAGKQAFPRLPAIAYPDISSQPLLAAEWALAPGSFVADLSKEDIQTIFWGPEGKPAADHPKAEQGDLPWMLFWEGYTISGSARYDGDGRLDELTVRGTKGRADFTLTLRLGALPRSCVANPDGETSEFNGVKISGWSRIYDRNGEPGYLCGSEFMTENGIGVRFENQNSDMRAEYGQEEDMALGGAQAFNALFVRQAVAGGLYLDHLASNGNIPAWREAEFITLAQARQEADFAPYLPAAEPEGCQTKEFYGRLSYQEGTQNMLFVRWSRGYDDVEVCVYLGGLGKSCNLVDPARPETYDLRLYSIPWCDSVPQEYLDTVNDPAFRVEDMSPELVEARGREKDTGGLRFDFEVLHPDGTVVSYRCDGLTAEQVWNMVKETLPSKS